MTEVLIGTRTEQIVLLVSFFLGGEKGYSLKVTFSCPWSMPVAVQGKDSPGRKGKKMEARAPGLQRDDRMARKMGARRWHACRTKDWPPCGPGLRSSSDSAPGACPQAGRRLIYLILPTTLGGGYYYCSRCIAVNWGMERLSNASSVAKRRCACSATG